ncbi:metallophosphoesterase [Corynebacterium resistens]|uniref:metallophosphoesterase n=1 Tax=Corynebacterium resistens TaxID=258224 RepID=UPI0001E289CD|nr:metallophosphoesterase [Corynebacterium resistens]
MFPNRFTTSKFAVRALTVASGITVAGFATAYLANREIRQFEMHEVTVPVFEPGALPEGWGSIRVLHLSDLHMLENQEAKEAFVAGLDTTNPDLVINTGDNLSSRDGVPAVIRSLNDLLSRPGAFVFGSNDYYAPRPVNPFIYLLGKKHKPSEEKLPWEGMRAAFVERGWHDATHQRLEFTIAPAGVGDSDYEREVKLAIAGVDDPHHKLDDYDSIAGPANPDADLKIGLSHSPEPYVLDRFSADGYHIVLSGHTHGGQICLPGGKAIVTNCGIDRNRARGLSRWSEKTWLHVTNGLGNSKYVPFRTFCRPSATLLHFVEREA